MSLDARDRSSIYTKLVPLLGEQDANTLMSQFPGSEGDELVTRHFLRAELAVLRGEMHSEIGGLREELGGLRSEMHTEIGGLRAEMHAEIGGLRTEMADRFRAQTVWLVGVVLVGMGLSATLAHAM